MYYTLNQPWMLRGYGKDAYVLDSRRLPYHHYSLSMIAMLLLMKCDGQQELDEEAMTEKEAAFFRDGLERGFLRRSQSPEPIEPWQAYRHLTNRRIESLHWSVTGSCNLVCKHCFLNDKTLNHSAKQPHFSAEDAVGLIRQMADCGVRSVALTGGEPLVNSDFMEICRALAGAGIDLGQVFTNGILLTREVLEEWKSLGFRPIISLSFDGVGTHDWFRGRDGLEEETKETIRRCIDAGFPVSVNCQMNSITRERMPETLRLLYGLGVRNAKVSPTIVTPSARQYFPFYGMEEYLEDVVWLTRELRPENRQGFGIHFSNVYHYVGRMTPEILRTKFKPGRTDQGEDSGWCGRAIHMPYLSNTGFVQPCIGWGYFCREDSNIKNRTLAEILTDSSYADFMRITQEDVLNANPECRECAYLSCCGGTSCRGFGTLKKGEDTLYLSKYGGALGRSMVTCEFYKGGYFNRIERFLKEA